MKNANTKKLEIRTERRETISPRPIFVIYEDGKELCWFHFLEYAFLSLQNRAESNKWISQFHRANPIDKSCEICDNQDR